MYVCTYIMYIYTLYNIHIYICVYMYTHICVYTICTYKCICVLYIYNIYVKLMIIQIHLVSILPALLSVNSNLQLADGWHI